ncbi:S-4TM family putative pore-forming effector [Micromonospora sp. M12]
MTADLTVSALLTQWFVPSLGVLLLGLEIYRVSGVAAERDRALALLQQRITAAARDHDEAGLLTLARQAQDLIFHSRQGRPAYPTGSSDGSTPPTAPTSRRRWTTSRTCCTRGRR